MTPTKRTLTAVAAAVVIIAAMLVLSRRDRARAAPAVAAADVTAAAVDYARADRVDDWLRDPVYGDPSFDTFERLAANPIRRGAPPYEWPVNGFFFRDPPTGDWYVYVGDYTRGYVGATTSRCVLLRSKDQGKSWEDLGTVLPEDPNAFDGDGKRPGHKPDVCVVYEAGADGRGGGKYHILYDWGKPDARGVETDEGGLAYAVADRPEGPFVRDPEPIQRRSTTKTILGRYNRPYAQTLVRRRDDWLVIADMDHAPLSWALYTMTSKNPNGPYSEPVLVRHVEDDYYHPPLIEGYPAFVHDGYLYAPTTSVAGNRNFQILFRAPLERAHEESAWELYQHGSVWHAEPVEHEHAGIWGQTFSGWVDERTGDLNVMFPSRDPQNRGTINLARRPWDKPYKDGFRLSGHAGRSLTLLRRAYDGFELAVKLRVRGTARIVWDYRAPLGPNRPTADATLHPFMLTRHAALVLAPSGWQLLRADAAGEAKVIASGAADQREKWDVTLHRGGRDGAARLDIDGKQVWAGAIPPQDGGDDTPGAIGLIAEAGTHVDVSRFQVAGDPQPARTAHLFTAALLGRGENPADWESRTGPDSGFRYGAGVVSGKDGAAVKWNVQGAKFELWAPRGPAYGEAEVLVDGKVAGEVDFRADAPKASGVVWSGAAEPGFHAVVLRRKSGAMPVDSLAVSD